MRQRSRVRGTGARRDTAREREVGWGGGRKPERRTEQNTNGHMEKNVTQREEETHRKQQRSASAAHLSDSAKSRSAF